MAFLRNIFDTRKISDEKPFMFFFLNPANHIESFSVISKSDMEPGCILLKMNPISIREIPTKAFPVWIFYVIEKFCAGSIFFEAFSWGFILLELEMISFLPIIFKLFFRGVGFSQYFRTFSRVFSICKIWE